MNSYGEMFDLICEYFRAYAASGYDADAADAFAAALADAPERLHGLFETFDCNGFERAAAAIGFAVTQDARLAVESERLTPQLLCAMLLGSDSVVECAALFHEDGVLYRLFDGIGATGAARMMLRRSILDYILHGEASRTYLRLLAPPDMAEADAHVRAAAEAITSALTGSDDMPLIIDVCGQPGIGRRTALRLASAACGVPFAVVTERGAALECAELAALSALHGALPVFCPKEALPADLLAAMAERMGAVLVVTEEPMDAEISDADVVPVRITLPSAAAQSEIWRRKSAAYHVAQEVDFREIAMEFSLPPGGIDKALRFAARNARGGVIGEAEIKRGCYDSVGSHMGSKAIEVGCAFGWDDLVLPPHSKKLLRTVCDYVRYGCTVYEKWRFGEKLPYGRGVSMIFSGPPGTGKTMAAQVIAGELSLSLYRVNLAGVVSKYIGETEKNLGEIFERAKKSRVVLFFDEADVLFGKRTEVRDSNDKYSNMEAAFLLQKIEEYSGIAILATNFVQNFDEAFKRRVKFLVEFPFPGKEERAEIWRRVFPAEAPLAQIDFDYLMENFELSGSNIKNIAVHSAFLAAADGAGAIGMQHVVAALKNEFTKSGKSFTRAEAGEYSYYLDE